MLDRFSLHHHNHTARHTFTNHKGKDSQSQSLAPNDGLSDAVEIQMASKDSHNSASGPTDDAVQKDGVDASDSRILYVALGMILSYFVIGIIMYMLVVESFSFTDTVYFLTVTLMTVGYGVLVPTSDGSRVFTMFFALFGAAVVGFCIVEITSYFVEQNEKLMRKKQGDLIKMAATDTDEETREQFKHDLLGDGKDSSGLIGRLTRSYPIATIFLSLAVYAVVFGSIFAAVEGWHVQDGIYFCIITGTTIGYGDITPSTTAGKWMSVFFIPFAVIFVSSQMSKIAEGIVGSRSGSKLNALLELDLSLEALLDMDQDGDGEITEFEYIRFMLTSSGLADGDMLDQLHSKFTTMDADGSGVLTKEDLLPPSEQEQEPIAASGIKVEQGDTEEGKE